VTIELIARGQITRAPHRQGPRSRMLRAILRRRPRVVEGDRDAV
jgi:hypothetical protein